jgi:hypothetical protein
MLFCEQGFFMINQPMPPDLTTQEKVVACGVSHENFPVFPDR